MTVFWYVCCVVSQKLSDIPEVLAVSVIRASVSCYETTRWNVPADIHLHVAALRT